MPEIPVSDLRSKLSQKFGFEESGSGRGPHDKYRLIVDGKYVAHTQIPRSKNPIKDTLAGMIAKQLGVTRKQLQLMLECDIDRDAYLKQLGVD